MRNGYHIKHTLILEGLTSWCLIRVRVPQLTSCMMAFSKALCCCRPRCFLMAVMMACASSSFVWQEQASLVDIAPKALSAVNPEGQMSQHNDYSGTCTLLALETQTAELLTQRLRMECSAVPSCT